MFGLKFQELMPDGVVLELDSFYKRLNRFLSESFNDDGSLISPAPAQISDLGLPVGAVSPYAGSTVPTGWLLCDGTAVSRSTYSTLFDVIGTTYGTGNGTTTFNIPNFQQKFPLGKAASGTGSTLGSTGGTIDHVHTGPSHTHTGPAHTHSITSGGGHTHTGPSHAHNTTIPRDGWGTGGGASSGRMETSDGLALPAGVSTASADQTVASSSSGTGNTSSDGSHDHGGTTGSEGTGATGAAGAGNTGSANPPFLAVNYIILYS